MARCKVCEHCGANLDFGERCDCMAQTGCGAGASPGGEVITLSAGVAGTSPSGRGKGASGAPSPEGKALKWRLRAGELAGTAAWAGS